MKTENTMAENKQYQQKLEDRTTDITIEEVKRLSKFRNYTDEQITDLINTIKQYTRIIYNLCSKQNKNSNRIALQTETKKQLAA